MRSSPLALLLALVYLCLTAASGAGAGAQARDPGALAQDPGALAHRAVYNLTLGQARSSSLVSDARGRFEFEWSDVCDGWAIQQRFRIALLYEDGITVNFGWSLASWESKDGKRYRFFIRRFDAAGQSEAVRGTAELGPDGSGRAVYSEPEQREIALPAGTLFPTSHTAHVLARAAVGEAPVWTLVFDGSGEEGLMGVSAAFSTELPPGSPTQLASPLLSDQPSWQMSLAFYQPDVANAEPEQEQALRLFANGVVDEMRLDYIDFVLNADLTELTELPQPQC